MQARKSKVNFIEGNLLVNLLRFILPIIATNLLQVLYNSADMIIVSLSPAKDAVGAVGANSSFVGLIVGIFSGFAIGTNVVVARNIGAKNEEGVQKAVHTSLIMAVIFGGACAVLGIALSKPILVSMGNQGKLLSLAVIYTRIYFSGLPFIALTNYLMAIFRAKGDSKTPLVVLSVSGFINVLFNFIFVVFLGLSVEGVALATLLANVLSFIVLLSKLRRDKDYTTFSFKKLKIDKKSFADIITIGVPSAIQSALFSLSNIFIQSSTLTVNNLLSPPDSAYQPVVKGTSAAGNLMGFLYQIGDAMGQGAITFTSQNIGAKNPKRIKPIMYTCLGVVAVLALTLGLLMIFLRAPLLSLYGVVDGEKGSLEALAMQSATIQMTIIGATYFTCGLQLVCINILRGMGKPITSTIITLITACFFRVVWLWTVFPFSQTLETIFISYPISWVLAVVTAFIMIQRLLKKHRQFMQE